MEFQTLPLVAQIGATLAGFAAITGVVRSDPLDLDAAFDIAAYGAITSLFSLAAILFVVPPHEEISLRLLSGGLAVITAASLARNVAVFAKAGNHPDPATAGVPASIGGVAALFILVTPALAAAATVVSEPSRASVLYEAALLSGIAVAVLLLLFIVAKHFAMK